MRSFGLIIVCLLLPLPAARAAATDTALSRQQVWAEVFSLEKSGKLEEAVKTLKENPIESYEYYYNLGTLFQKLGKSGSALAYLSKASKMRSDDPDVKKNLQLARRSLEQALGSDRLDPASSWVEMAADFIANPELQIGLGSLAFALIVLGSRSYLRNRRFNKAGIAGLTGVTSLLLAVYIQSTHPAALSVQAQVIRSGPGDWFLDLGAVEAGVKVRLLGTAPTQSEDGERWYQVRYARKSTGWIRGSQLVIL